MAHPYSDHLDRKVLYAVELTDAVTGSRVTDGVALEPLDAAGQPLSGRTPSRSHTGRFVWLQPGNLWPAGMRVRPKPSLPYVARDEVVAPPKADPTIAADNSTLLKPEDRLVRILLAPAPAYPFEGTTAVRGILREAGPGSATIKDAIVQLAWRDHAGWLPLPPLPVDPRKPAEAVTDAQGQFAVFLPMLGRSAQPDEQDGKLNLRLQVTRRVSGVTQTLWTPNPPAAPPGLRPGWWTAEGQMYDAVSIRWDQLVNS